MPDTLGFASLAEEVEHDDKHGVASANRRGRNLREPGLSVSSCANPIATTPHSDYA